MEEIASVENVNERWGDLWKREKPKWTIGKLRKAIKAHCSWCNGIWHFDLGGSGKTTKGHWTIEKDCQDPDCPWYPFRPGDGPGRVERRKPSRKRREQLAHARSKSPVCT